MVLYTVLAASYLGYGLKQSISYSKFPGTRLGISALEGLRLDEDYVFELQAMDLIRQDERKVINIVEAPGDSYSHQSMLSVVSGACTTVGWFAHEWLWQSDVDLVSERTNQTASFYCMGDTEYCREYLKRYDVDYVFVGPAEVSKYPVNINGFAPLGEICLRAQWRGQNLVLVRIDKSKL